MYFGGAHSIPCTVHMQLIACLIHDQANIGGAIAPPAPMVPTPMYIYIYIEVGTEQEVLLAWDRARSTYDP